MFGQLKKKIVD